MPLAPLLSWYRNLRRRSRILITSLFFLTVVGLVLQASSHRSSLSFPQWLKGITNRSPYYSNSGGRFYAYDTPSVFPPLNASDTDKSSADLCDGFPRHMLDKVQIVLRTGIGESERTQAHLRTLSSCISNLIILSDVEERTEKHHYIDVFADLPKSYFDDENPDLAKYIEQKKAFEKGEKVGKSKGGWALDKYKFVPMVDRAYAMNPTASWFVFIEADVYMFWDNLFRFLNQLDPEQMHYLGSAVAGARGVWFAYGGAGLVMSRALVKGLTKDGSQQLSAKYEKLVKGDCCGDAVIGYMVFDEIGVRIDQLYPMFSGDDLIGIRANEERWCVPIISLHRANPESMERLWHWERTRPYNENPITYSDLFQFALPALDTSYQKEFWENDSDEEQPEESAAHESALACEQACFSDTSCLQFKYGESKCKFMKFAIPGHSNKDQKKFISGWDLAKLRKFGSQPDGDMSGGCKKIMWPRPGKL